MSFKLDLHVHTHSFARAMMTPDQLRAALPARGLDGIAVTNFFNIGHARWLRDQLPEFVILVGQEIWTREGHLIGLGLERAVANFQPAAETVRQIQDQGGLAVAVHPYLHMGVGRAVYDLGADAVEVYNAALGPGFIYNFLARRAAARGRIPGVAGSDTMDADYLGQAHTEVLTDDRDDILGQIRAGNVRLVRRPLPFPWLFTFQTLLGRRDLPPCRLHASMCFICGYSMTTQVLKKHCRCCDCGAEVVSRVRCCNGHYFCRSCMVKRIEAADDPSRYAQERSFWEDPR